MVGLTHALVGTRPPKWVVGALTALGAILFVLVYGSALVVTEEVYIRTNVFGTPSVGIVAGPLVLLFVPCFGLIGAYCVTLVTRGSRLSHPERRAVIAGFVAYALFALNDLLYLGRVISSVRLFDFAFVAVALGLSWMLARRYNHLTEHLAQEVMGGTAQLTALLGAVKAIATGLDLTPTLERILEQALRITGCRHVAVLLLDRSTGLLRPAAFSGGAFPKDLSVPLGAPYSGIVAATGKPLFIADTRLDPRNPIPDHDRRHGIMTYLGLPIQTGDVVLGVLGVRTDYPRTWTEEEMAYLSSFADQAAIAITMPISTRRRPPRGARRRPHSPRCDSSRECCRSARGASACATTRTTGSGSRATSPSARRRPSATGSVLH